MNARNRFRRALLAAVVATWLLPGAAAAGEEHACTKQVTLRLTSTNPVQGDLVLFEVVADAPVAKLDARAFGRRLYFWRENPGHTFRALVGVDLDRRPGAFPLTVNTELKSGERVACSVLARVAEGEFALERLTVKRKFVELSPKDLERARRESRRLREILSQVSPRRLWRGPFRPPLEGVEGSGNFGRRRILNNEPRSPHSGEDYPAPAGTPVRAPQRGRVVLADDFFFSGNTVVLDHGLGLFTFYGHLESIAVQEGALVEPGDLVGRVGATGRVTGPHLHWAIRLNRARVDPHALLAVLSE